MKKGWSVMNEEKMRFPLSSQSVITVEHYRFTVLTPKLIRLEYAENGVFEDRATQTVLNRQFPVPAFRKLENDVSLEIITEAFHLHYLKKGPFSPDALFIDVKSNFTNYKNRGRRLADLANEF
ncbi:glycoside hydrolase [Heyndrickxia coagulans]|nr:glycoside hydrolase [Heyndrickxia coagulans]RGR94815.1 glycoside hydrolase [Heyndrickxia coagulans]